MRRLVVAGVTSGVGKTTVSCALMAAFRQRGHTVQPFKAGPDYIDPTHHTLAAGRPSRNLDSFMLPPDTLRALFARAAERVDLSLIEGVMGLYDGRNGGDDEGSTAEIAKLLEAPVVVVVDVARTSRTVGAIALGLVQFDPRVHIVGFILNNVGSETHQRWAAEAIARAAGLPVLGALPRNGTLAIPERHLGLVPTTESPLDPTFFDRLAHLAETQLDLDRIWALAEECPPSPPTPLPHGERGAQPLAPTPLPHGERGAQPLAPISPRVPGTLYARRREREDELPPSPLVGEGVGGWGVSLFPFSPGGQRAAVALARDAAFSFYYQDNLELLEAWGAEIVPFSPLEGRLPLETQGIYLGGGFPELFAEALAANQPLHRELRAAACAGLPIYAECGGLMYLSRSLADFEGRRHRLVGLVPFDSAMQRRRASLGYRTVTSLRPSPLLEAGKTVRGHEFHWSALEQPIEAETAAYHVAERAGALEGYGRGSVLASYVHLHFGADAAIAPRFVAACAAAPRFREVRP